MPEKSFLWNADNADLADIRGIRVPFLQLLRHALSFLCDLRASAVKGFTVPQKSEEVPNAY